MTEQEKMTQENTLAIRELTVIATQTSQDVDRLITHLDKVPVVRIVSLEKRMKDIEDACKARSWWAFTTVIAILGVFVYQHFFGGVK